MHTKTENLGRSGTFTLRPNGGGDPIRIELNNGECLLSFSDSFQLEKGTGAAAGGGVGGGAPRSG